MSDGRLNRHEAGHVVIGQAVGRSPRGVTVRGGTRWAGCARSAAPPIPDELWAECGAERPFVSWPAPIRAQIEGEVVMLMAGELSALMLAPPSLGRTEPTVVEQAIEQAAVLATEDAALPEVRAQVEAITADLDEIADDDQTKIARLAWLAHGPDHASAAAWLTYLAAQCRALITVEAARIIRLSEALAIRDTLTGDQVAALLRSDRR